MQTAPQTVERIERTVRPWGWYETVSEAPGHKIKRIGVLPGQRLSLQKHSQRTEHWVVVRGTARVTLGEQSFDLAMGQHCDIALGQVHRLTNVTTQAVEIIEVQFGAYLGEDDIVRLGDDYGRVRQRDKLMTSNVLIDGFQLPAGAAPVACVDIGGTKVAVNIVDAQGARGKVVEPTATSGSNDTLALQIIRLVDQSCAMAGVQARDIARVGVSSCGPFVLNHGLVELAAPNICGGQAGPARGLPNDWKTALLEAPLRAAFAHVRVENDGIGALEAERRWGALQIDGVPMDNCAYVTWSTGIGTGLCVDGHVLRGKNGNAGHAGHIFVSDNMDALCGCGNVGDVEGLIAGNALARRFASAGYINSAALFVAAYAGDTRAMAIIDDICQVMGRMLYSMIATLDLARISIGGSVYWHHRDYLLPRLRDAVHGKLPPLTEGCELVSAGLGERVGDFGALALVA